MPCKHFWSLLWGMNSISHSCRAVLEPCLPLRMNPPLAVSSSVPPLDALSPSWRSLQGTLSPWRISSSILALLSPYPLPPLPFWSVASIASRDPSFFCANDLRWAPWICLSLGYLCQSLASLCLIFWSSAAPTALGYLSLSALPSHALSFQFNSKLMWTCPSRF